MGDALSFTVARRIPRPALLVGPDLSAMVQRLVSGASGVPEVLISELAMGEEDWSAVCSALPALARLDLRVGEVDSLGGVRHLLRQEAAEVVMVHQPDELGGRAEVVGAFHDLAVSKGVAVVAAIPPGGDVVGGRSRPVELVRVTSTNGGTRAHMVRPDPVDMLSVATAKIDYLRVSAA